LLESVLNQVTEQLSAEPYERMGSVRAGSYPHKLITRVRTIRLRVPRIWGGKFSTELFVRYQRSFGFDFDGDCDQRGFYPQGDQSYRRAVRHRVFQIDGFRSMQTAGSHRDRLYRSSLAGRAVPLPYRGCYGVKSPGGGARACPRSLYGNGCLPREISGNS
jgi:hypothetical protein